MLSLFEENKGIKEMTKEQLAEEIENKGVEYADSINYTIPKFSDENGYCWGQVEEAYEKGALDFAEPREKRIEELEQQIEQMKCDVKQEQSHWNSGEMQYDLYQRLLDKWEIKENG